MIEHNSGHCYISSRLKSDTKIIKITQRVDLELVQSFLRPLAGTVGQPQRSNFLSESQPFSSGLGGPRKPRVGQSQRPREASSWGDFVQQEVLQERELKRPLLPGLRPPSRPTPREVSSSASGLASSELSLHLRGRADPIPTPERCFPDRKLSGLSSEEAFRSWVVFRTGRTCPGWASEGAVGSASALLWGARLTGWPPAGGPSTSGSDSWQPEIQQALIHKMTSDVSHLLILKAHHISYPILHESILKNIYSGSLFKHHGSFNMACTDHNYNLYVGTFSSPCTDVMVSVGVYYEKQRRHKKHNCRKVLKVFQIIDIS